MHRQALEALLQDYISQQRPQAKVAAVIADFVAQHPNCFAPDCLPGHITGSCWLLNTTADKVLLTHHRKLGMWLQLGGHADDDDDILGVALREAREESGIDAIVPLSSDIFDVDIHLIPARADMGEHYHYDIRFLAQAQHDQITISEESIDLRWFNAEALARLPVDESVRRMARLWQQASNSASLVPSPPLW